MLDSTASAAPFKSWLTLIFVNYPVFFRDNQGNSCGDPLAHDYMHHQLQRTSSSRDVVTRRDGLAGR